MSDEFDDAVDPAVQHPSSVTFPVALAKPAKARVFRLIARLYASSDRTLRAALLSCLVRPLSPLGLAAIAAGAFAGLLQRTGAEGVRVTIDDVSRFSGEQIAELARFVEQVSPEALQQFARLVMESHMSTAGLSAAAAVWLWREVCRAPRPMGAAAERIES
jgi:hypothetical protein